MSMIKTQAASLLAITLGLGLASPVFAASTDSTGSAAADASLSTAPLAANGQLDTSASTAATGGTSDSTATTSTTADGSTTTSDATQEDAKSTKK